MHCIRVLVTRIVYCSPGANRILSSSARSVAAGQLTAGRLTMTSIVDIQRFVDFLHAVK